MKILSSKYFQFFYIFICLILFIQLVTGYFFTVRFLNTILLAIIISYPLARFFIAKIPSWIKILVALTLVGSIILIANDVLILLAFGTESEKKVNVWKLNRQKVFLTRRQGWSGPSYLRYDLVDLRLFGLFSKTIAYGYPASDSCKIMLENDNHGKLFEFDLCKVTLINVDKVNR